MAGIKEIVDEFIKVAEAYTEVNTFIFDEINAINDDRRKKYPAILVDSRNISINPVRITRSFLPDKVDYTVKVFFYDTYNVSEQKHKKKQSKYDELVNIAFKYFAEIQRRFENGDVTDFYLERTTINNGFVVDKLHNDDLVQVTFDVLVKAKGNCTTGTFNY